MTRADLIKKVQGLRIRRSWKEETRRNKSETGSVWCFEMRLSEVVQSGHGFNGARIRQQLTRCD
jgi:hypothetical protein